MSNVAEQVQCHTCHQPIALNLAITCNCGGEHLVFTYCSLDCGERDHSQYRE